LRPTEKIRQETCAYKKRRGRRKDAGTSIAGGKGSSRKDRKARPLGQLGREADRRVRDRFEESRDQRDPASRTCPKEDCRGKRIWGKTGEKKGEGSQSRRGKKNKLLGDRARKAPFVFTPLVISASAGRTRNWSLTSESGANRGSPDAYIAAGGELSRRKQRPVKSR